jgi:hypothetical protein
MTYRLLGARHGRRSQGRFGSLRSRSLTAFGSTDLVDSNGVRARPPTRWCAGHDDHGLTGMYSIAFPDGEVDGADQLVGCATVGATKDSTPQDSVSWRCTA